MKALLLFACLASTVVHADTIDAPAIVHKRALNGCTVLLHELPGPCVAGATLVNWASANDMGSVQSTWIDTDTSALPTRALRRLDGS